MIIELEKRDVVISQTEEEFRVKHLCRTIFIPESDGDVVIVRKFVEEQLDREAPSVRDGGCRTNLVLSRTEIREILEALTENGRYASPSLVHYLRTTEA